MLQVVVGALLALITRWVLEGGIRRRNLQVLREELELLKHLPASSYEARKLDRMAKDRLDRYLKGSFWSKLRLLPREYWWFILVYLSATVGLLLLVWDQLAADLRDLSLGEGLVAAAAGGATAGVLLAWLEGFLDWMLARRRVRQLPPQGKDRSGDVTD